MPGKEKPPKGGEELSVFDEVKAWVVSGGELRDGLLDDLRNQPDQENVILDLARAVYKDSEDTEEAAVRFQHVLVVGLSAFGRSRHE